MHLFLLVSRNCGENPDDFYLKCNKLLYPINGTMRKGHNIPLLTRWNVYEIRIREEVAAKFLEDVGAIDIGGKLHSDNHEYHIPNEFVFKYGLFKIKLKRTRIVEMVRSALGLKGVEYDRTQGGKNNYFHGFTYTIFLGGKNDPRDTNGCELL